MSDDAPDWYQDEPNQIPEYDLLRRLALRPYCGDCGWRKGGPDSWDGASCKCGHQEPRIRNVDTGGWFFPAANNDNERR